MRYISISGPTAAGKSKLAKVIATELGGEIVSCDSVQVFREFNIGSAKESIGVRQEIPHHMIDIVDWHESYDAARYARDARQVIAEINERGRMAIVVGGTGLYLRALIGDKFHDLPSDPLLRAELDQKSTEDLYQRLMALDPQRGVAVHQHDRVRILRAVELNTLLGKPVGEMVAEHVPQFPPMLSIYLNPARAELHQTISRRSQHMIDLGLIEEVASLMVKGCPPTIKPMLSIGYAQVAGMLLGTIHRDDLLNRIIFATRQYAKRQCTWFGKLNHDLSLTTLEDIPAIIKLVARRLAASESSP